MRAGLGTIKQIDLSLSSMKQSSLLSPPAPGWVRTIRKALGMTIAQLANRMQLNPSRIVKIEMSENTQGITLRTMQSVADALECDFVYGLVPRSSLEAQIKERAHALARKQVMQAAHSMDLEDQSVDAHWIEEQITLLTEAYLQKSWKHLWEE